jgi:N6-L-threonylcarbamoyladenine synthase
MPQAKAFDKSAKLLGLGFPGGPAVERAALSGNPKAVPFAAPDEGACRAAFLLRRAEKCGAARARCGVIQREDIAASFQQAVVDCLLDRTKRAILKAPHATALVVAGGVAANGAVRAGLEGLAAKHGLPFFAPPLWLCTDNAAMIAWAGAERFAAGLVDGMEVQARARWPLDPSAEAVRGAGVKA